MVGGYALAYIYDYVTPIIGGVTVNGVDIIVTPSLALGGIQLPSIEAMGFFLLDTIDHNSYEGGQGEYITRVVQDSNASYNRFDFDFKGVNDVFIGYVKDVTGFQGLWAGWYRNDGQAARSANYQGTYNGFNHILVPAAYVGGGGDPHLVKAFLRALTRSCRC